MQYRLEKNKISEDEKDLWKLITSESTYEFYTFVFRRDHSGLNCRYTLIIVGKTKTWAVG